MRQLIITGHNAAGLRGGPDVDKTRNEGHLRLKVKSERSWDGVDEQWRSLNPSRAIKDKTQDFGR